MFLNWSVTWCTWKNFEVLGWFACCCCCVVFFFNLWMCLKQLWLSMHYCLICACFCSLSFSPYAVSTEQQLMPLSFFAAAMYYIYLSMYFAQFDSFFLVEHVIWKHYIYIYMHVCIDIYVCYVNMLFFALCFSSIPGIIFVSFDDFFSDRDVPQLV